MQGVIQATKPSKSGKTLGVCINDVWYSAKAFELAQMQNQEITFTTSQQTFPDGGSIQWINDYSPVGAVPTTADQAFQAAHAQAPAQAAPRPAPPSTNNGTNKDCSIIAQALTKACTAPGDDTLLVWNRYRQFYILAKEWDGQPEAAPAPAGATNAPQQGSPAFDDEIPF